VIAREAIFNSTDDFHDKNIMSYCFDSKENKSFKMAKRNDQILGLLKNQFTSKDDQARLDEMRIQQYSDKINKEKAASEEAKALARKEKEMSTKLF